ncbi:MAG: biopolymer transporter ExbD [Bacteroidetes bacterium]|nr:biopolymer transporter ExbD [Bacteroidota bacterium]
MSKFKKDSGKSVPGVNTSSLPDIVFMLLFFFMVATTSKEVDPTVQVTQPVGGKTTDLTPYKQRSEIDFLYLGEPRNKARLEDFKMGYALSLDNVVQATADELYTTNAVGQWKKDKFEEKKSRVKVPIEGVITCLKADKGAPTGLIFDIRKELQAINALSIAYAVRDNGNI